MKNMKVRAEAESEVPGSGHFTCGLSGYCFRQRHGRCERQSTGNDGCIVPQELSIIRSKTGGGGCFPVVENRMTHIKAGTYPTRSKAKKIASEMKSGRCVTERPVISH